MKKHEFEFGKWNKLPHYAVIGDVSSFYVCCKDENFPNGKNCDFLHGENSKYWHILKKLHKENKREEFKKLAYELIEKFPSKYGH